MSNQNNPTDDTTRSFLSRVLDHDSAKRGAAVAIAGVVVAVVQEALWPSK